MAIMIELIDNSVVKVLTIFSVSPGSRFQRKLLKEKTGLPNIILDKTLNKLTNIKILKREKNLYSIDHKNAEIKNIDENLKKRGQSLDQVLTLQGITIDKVKDQNLKRILRLKLF